VPVTVAWAGGGTATIASTDGERVELTSSRAFAPGSRPEGTLEGVAANQRIWMKVHGSRRQEDGSYLVRGRLLNVTRELRDLLKEAVRPQISGKDPDS
jgi:hypothetical protein